MHGVAAGEAFLDEYALAGLLRLFDYRRLARVRPVVGEHEHVDEFGRAQAALDSLGTHAGGAQQAFVAHSFQGFEAVRVVENVEVAAVGMDQN